MAVLAPKLVRAGFDRLVFPEHRKEISRSTSPDKIVDAVLEGADCGAPCSLNYFVSIVPKGGAASLDQAKQVFLADDAVNLQIRWSEPHLLEIGYDRALIQRFRNVAYPFATQGDARSWQYMTEIRLAPSSRFSYLTYGNVAGGPR